MQPLLLQPSDFTVISKRFIFVPYWQLYFLISILPHMHVFMLLGSCKNLKKPQIETQGESNPQPPTASPRLNFILKPYLSFNFELVNQYQTKCIWLCDTVRCEVSDRCHEGATCTDVLGLDQAARTYSQLGPCHWSWHCCQSRRPPWDPPLTPTKQKMDTLR